MSTVLALAFHLLLGIAFGYQFGNTIIKLAASTPLRWVDYASAAAFVAVLILNIMSVEVPAP